MNKGTVVLVGAGPSADLLTLSGKQEIEQADVLVYDDLIDEQILSYAKAGCELVYVGKRYGHHSKRQEEINAILLQKANEGKEVVRLKGGDSFVFGRGGEELLALQSEGIPTCLIPGISTCIAVPEEFGIPVTHRGVAKSFTVVTGHNADDIRESYEALAKLKGSLIFLMSLHNIPQISAELIRNGKAADTPCSVLSRGFHPDRRRVDGTLTDISGKLDSVAAPAIFMVGQTTELTLAEPKATVNVVGSQEFCSKFREGAVHRQLEARKICNLKTVPMFEGIPSDFEPYSHLAFTSAKGVHLFFQFLAEQGVDLRSLANVQFACVGQQCANALKQHGFTADLVPERFSGKDLADLLIQKRATHVLILRSARGSADLPDLLTAAGIPCTDAHIYTMARVDSGNAPEADYTVFGSGDAVRYYFESNGLGTSKPVCIGKVTEAVLRRYTDQIILTAPQQTVDRILETILEDIKVETFETTETDTRNA